MRHLDFLGLVPKAHPEKLEFNTATIAENCDLYGAAIHAIRAPKYKTHVVDVLGAPFLGNPKTVFGVQGITIGFVEHTWVVTDPQGSAVDEEFLFVTDGQLWRSSPYRVLRGMPPVPVSIAPPCTAPVGVPVAGGRPRPGFPTVSCLENGYTPSPTDSPTPKPAPPCSDNSIPVTLGVSVGGGGSSGFPGPAVGTADAPPSSAHPGGATYSADTNSHVIRVTDTAITTTARLTGKVNQPGTADGDAATAQFRLPRDVVYLPQTIAFPDGRLVIVDSGNNTLRQVDLATTTTTVVVGTTGVSGKADGIGVAAEFAAPRSATYVPPSTGFAEGRIFVADTSNHTIRMVDVATWAVTTYAGVAGVKGGEDGIGAAALFSTPTAIRYEAGVLSVLDGNGLRTITLATGMVTTTPPSTTGCSFPFTPEEQVCNDGQVPMAAAYVVTYVQEYECPSWRSEESAPSPISTVIDVPPGASVSLIDTATPPPGATARRWYRSVVATDGTTAMLFVAQTPIASPTFLDTIPTPELGEVLYTEEHMPHPPCIEGVALTGNDVVVVWHGRNIFLSEPKLPHAFKPRNKYEVLHDIVGIQGYTGSPEGQTHYSTVVLTKGQHYGLLAAKPEQASIVEVQEWAQCLGARSILPIPGGVVFNTEKGPALISGTSFEYILDEIVTEREWVRFSDPEIEFRYWSNRLFGFGETSWFFHLGPKGKERARNFVTLTPDVVASWAAPGERMTVVLRTADIASSYEWAGADHTLQWRWATKMTVQSGLWAPVSMKVVGDLDTKHGNAGRARAAYEVWQAKWGRAHPDPIQFFQEHPEFQPYWHKLRGWQESVLVRVASDRRLLYERRVSHREPFRLPSAFRDIAWTVDISGHADVWEIHIQTSNEDLTQEGGHG